MQGDSEEEVSKQQGHTISQTKKNLEQAEHKQISSTKQKLFDLTEKSNRNHELNFCETGTKYHKLLDSYDSRVNFDIIQTIAKNKVSDFTDEEKDQTFAALMHGTAHLQNKKEMYQYLNAYGKMHRAKLDAAFEVCITGKHYLFEHSRAPVQIIDYGCGQAIGTVCFIDYMNNIIKRLPNITTIRLIEPSEIVLKRGVLHVRSIFKGTSSNPTIYGIHKELSDIRNDHLTTDHQSVKFHIFSNILDMDAFSIDILCSRIVSTQKGKNYFICVSPKINDIRNQRVNYFCNYFRTNHNATLISARESDIGTWKRYERVFSVNLT